MTTGKAKIKQKGVEIIKVKKYKGRINLKTVLAELGKRNIPQVLVEGGEKVITSFLKQKLADEVIIYASAENLAKKGKIKSSQQMKNLYNWLKNNYKEKKRFNTDISLTGFTK